MGPKKKEKSKTSSDWLQCSLCGRLILPSDAEVHSKSCDMKHPFILEKRFTGIATKAEDLVDEAKNSLAKSVRDKDAVVWIPVSVMTMCGMAIGQLVVVSNSVVRKAWPLTSGKLSVIGLSKQNLDEMKLKEGSLLSVSRLVSVDRVVESATLQSMESNEIFEKEEFLSYVASYLDGAYLTQGSLLRIKYFGQTCRCKVLDIQLSPLPSQKCPDKNVSLKDSEISLSHSPASSTSHSPHVTRSDIASSTPVKPSGREHFSSSADSNDLSLSTSFSSLDIADDSVSTPRTQAKDKFPTLNTPTLHASFAEGEGHDGLNEQEFGKVVSGQSRLSLLPFGVKEESRQKANAVGCTLSDLGGMSDKIEELKHRIHRAQQPGSLSRCVLVHGPPGCGKSMLVRAVTGSLDGVHCAYIAGTDIWSKLFGQAEANLKNIFKSATDKSPSVVVLDDLDVICPKRTQQTAGQQEQRIVGTLLSLVDGGSRKRDDVSSVVVIGISNNKDNIDPALRRSGRFGCEVEVAVPGPAQRAEILRVLLRKVPHSLSSEDIESVAKNAHGYVGADLTALINEASIHAASDWLDTHPDIPQDKAAPVAMAMKDFVYAGQLVKPSALREIQLEVPEVRWGDIGGMTEVKMRLREAVELPLSHPSLFHSLGIDPPRGLLMYGPPGCSKTMIARAVATECHLNFLAVKGPELFNQYVGESEKAIREVFRKARAASPSVVFFDEIDAIAGKRGSGSGGSGVDDRVLTQLLTEMDGLEHLKDVFIMAATNRPDKIDRALLRPGRFDSLIYVPLPDAETRREILETKLKKMKTSGEVETEYLVDATQDYSGAEVIQLCQEAALTALREDINTQEVLPRHFDAALAKVLPQTDQELLQIYDKFSSSR